MLSAGAHDLTPENDIPIGRNVLQLNNIQESANFTCIAASSLGQIEAVSVVKVQCEWESVKIKDIYITPLYSFAYSSTHCPHGRANLRGDCNFGASGMVVQGTRRSAVLCHTIQTEECESGV